MKLKSGLMALILLGLLSGCGANPADFTAQGHTLSMVGAIKPSTPEDLADALADTPSATQLQLVSVPGSTDDERTLKPLVDLIQGAGLDTVVPSNGMTASGGTDMALMGVRRVIEPGACIGVHSWATGGAFGTDVDSGADLPRDAPEHQLYLGFYDSIGIPREFYWFTLAMAGPDDIHWMSPQEINSFGLSHRPLPSSTETVAARAERCWQRVP